MSLIIKIMIGLCVYVFFLIMYLPAQWVVKLAPLPSHVVVSDPQGTLWQGQASMVKIGPRQIDLIHWKLNPWGLLQGQVDLNFSVGNNTTALNAKGDVAWSMSGISAQNLRVDASSAFLLAGSPLPFKTNIKGDVSLVVETLVQGQPWCEQLNGKLFLNDIDVNNQFGQYPLGNINFDLSCTAGQVVLATDESQNKLGVTGSISLIENNSAIMNAKIRPLDSQPEDLRKSLIYLGKQDSQGFYAMTYHGRIPGM